MRSLDPGLEAARDGNLKELQLATGISRNSRTIFGIVRFC